jgi:phenylacetic acid degradation operon negative regulatory protein
MLHCVIAVSTHRNELAAVALDARSLALSALLGTHPPVLPGRALAALAELFGIAGGTMRTALSRMVATGELSSSDGRYRLEGRLLDRQRAQDLGRRAPDERWDGTWHTMVAVDTQRPLADRRRVRRVMADHRMGELRPDVWLRPANLEPPTIDGWLRTTGPMTGADSAELATRLWELDTLAASAGSLLAALDAAGASIPDTFRISAATVRFLRSDPLLPRQLLPLDWPVDDLRRRYDEVERDLQATLREFFARATRPRRVAP